MEPDLLRRGRFDTLFNPENDTGRPPRLIENNGHVSKVHDAGNFPYLFDALIRKKFQQEPRNLTELPYFAALEGAQGVAIEAAIMGVAELNIELFDLMVRQSLDREEDYQLRTLRRSGQDTWQLLDINQIAEARRKKQEVQEAFTNSVALDYIADIIKKNNLPLQLKTLCF